MKSIIKKLLLYFLITSFIPICMIGASSYIISAKILKDKLNDGMESEVRLIANNIKTNMDGINKYLDYIFTNKTIMHILNTFDFKKINSELFTAHDELGKVFDSYFCNDPHLLTAAIFSFDGGHYTYKSNLDFPITNLRQREWYNTAQELNGAICWIGMEDMSTDESLNGKNLGKGEENQQSSLEPQWVFSMARMLKSIDSEYFPLKPLGIIYLSFSEQIFYQSYNFIEGGNNKTIYIIDNNGNIMSSSNKQNIGRNFFELNDIQNNFSLEKNITQAKIHGKDVLVAYHTVPNWGWKVVEIVPYKYILEQIRWITIITVFISLLCVCALYILSLYTSKKIAEPLLELNEAMKKAEGGGFGHWRKCEFKR